MPFQRPVDKQIGRRLQARRLALKLNVDDLAQSLGLEARELESWEAGTTRIGARNLRFLCEFLGVNSAYFFAPSPDGHDDSASTEPSCGDPGGPDSTESLRLLRAFRRIAHATAREHVIEIAEQLAGADPSANSLG